MLIRCSGANADVFSSKACPVLGSEEGLLPALPGPDPQAAVSSPTLSLGGGQALQSKGRALLEPSRMHLLPPLCQALPVSCPRS